MQKNNKFAKALLSLSVFLLVFFIINPKTQVVAITTTPSPFSYNFTIDGSLQEAGSLGSSNSPYWWVSSGGYMNMNSGRGWTVQGSLPDSNSWRLLYNNNNPLDTDNGYHPQNIFRLVTKQTTWKNINQQAYFKITKDNLSASPNRNQSNGLLFFNRYIDQYNLYYTGIRRDGSAVIKKKQNGTYYTLSQPFGIFPGTYNAVTSPNLLPLNTWLGLKSEVTTLVDGSVSIKLYMDKNWNNNWKLIAEAIDNGKYGAPILQGGSGGIRTDFMDVMFDQYKLEEIQ